MPRNSKAKLEVYAEIPLELTNSGKLDLPLEKRKEDARKPLYLKRM